MKKYDPWPSGKLPLWKQRPELALVMQQYGITEPREVIDLFERQIAEYCDALYAVAVDSCTNAIFLSLKYNDTISGCMGIKQVLFQAISLPKHTYISVPQTVINTHCQLSLSFRDEKWLNSYELIYKIKNKHYKKIFDCAQNFNQNSYIKNSFCCLSFQIKKTIPIGKGGMILTDDFDAVKWFRKARYEGRDVTKPYDKDQIDFIGWNMYMTPEDAARGVVLLEDHIANKRKQKVIGWENYTDLSKQKVFKRDIA